MKEMSKETTIKIPLVELSNGNQVGVKLIDGSTYHVVFIGRETTAEITTRIKLSYEAAHVLAELIRPSIPFPKPSEIQGTAEEVKP
jgi:hypothetical protein